MTHHRHGFERRARRRVVERLAHLPRPAHLLRLALDVAAGHVEPDAIAPHMLERLLDGDVLPALGDRDHHLDLVVDVLRAHRIRHGRAVLHDGIRRLHEEERRLAVGVVPHLARVLGVVAAHAVDAPHRKACVAALDGQGRGGADVDDVLGVAKVVFTHGGLSDRGIELDSRPF